MEVQQEKQMQEWSYARGNVYLRLMISIVETLFVMSNPKIPQQNQHSMIPPSYLSPHALLPPPNPTSSPNHSTRSPRSGKTASRKGSTDIDSRSKFKTETCKYWLNGMVCPFNENCNFAHGDEEIRTRDARPSKYKTRPCLKFIQEGFCPYGKRCQFIHQTLEGKRVEHRQVLECLGAESEKFYAFLEEREKNSGRSGRLPIFQSLGQENGQEKGGYAIRISEVFRPQGEDGCPNHVDVRARHNSF